MAEGARPFGQWPRYTGDATGLMIADIDPILPPVGRPSLPGIWRDAGRSTAALSMQRSSCSDRLAVTVS